MKRNIDYTVVDESNIDTVMTHLSSLNCLFGFDTETNKDGTIHFIQIYSPVSEQTFIFYGDCPQIHKLTTVWNKWGVVGHNLQYDLIHCIKQYGTHPNPVADTFLLSCSLQESAKALKILCSQYFHTINVVWEYLFGDYDYSNMTEEKWNYVANDPYYTYVLFEHYRQVGAYRFVKQAHAIDMNVMLHYVYASVRGLQIDQNKFNEYLNQYTEQVDSLQEKLNLYAGWDVRTASPKEVKKLLFEQMQLSIPPITTGRGDISVSKEALTYVDDKDGIVSLILKIKESRAILSAMKGLLGDDV